MGSGGGSTWGMIIGAVAGVALIALTGGAASPLVASWMSISTTAGAILYGAALGATIGGLVGGIVSPMDFNGPEVQGPQIAELQIMGVAEGTGVTLAFGHQSRLPGQLLYAGNLVETSHQSQNPTNSGKSFLAGTEITIEGGQVKPIEEVEVGDVVLTCRSRWWRRPKWEYRQVTETLKGETSRVVTFTINDRDTSCTVDHEVYGYKPDQIKPKWHWFQAQSLMPGDCLIGPDGPQVVEDVTATDGEYKTYNLEVKKNHNYLANGCLVHNGGGGGGGSAGTTTWYTYSTDIAVAFCEGPVERIDRLILNGKNIYKFRRRYTVEAPTNCGSLTVTLIADGTWQGGGWTGSYVFTYKARYTVNSSTGDGIDSNWRAGQTVSVAGFSNSANNFAQESIAAVNTGSNYFEIAVEGTSVPDGGGYSYTHTFYGPDGGEMSAQTDSSAAASTYTIPWSNKHANAIRCYRGDDGTGGNDGGGLDTFYENDVPDSILTSGQSSPAYRGIAYAAIDNLELADFGNQIPQTHAIVDCRHEDVMATTWDGEAVTYMHAADVIDRVLLRAGRTKANGIGGTYTAGDHFNSDALRSHIMTVRGYAVVGPKATMSILSNIMLRYDIVVSEEGGCLTFMKRGNEGTAEVLESDLSAKESDAEEPPPKFSISDQPDTALSTEINVQYFDVNDKGQRASQKAARSAGNQQPRNDSLDVPMFMTASEAQEVGNRVLYQTWQNRTICTFALGPRYVNLNENDILTVPCDGQTYKVRVMEINRGVNYVHDIKGLLMESETLEYDGTGEDGTDEGGEVYIPPVMQPILLDTPPLRNQDVLSPGLYIAGYTMSEDAEFQGAAIWNSYSTVYEEIAPYPTEPVVVQHAGIAAIQAGPLNVWDDTTTIIVQVISSSLHTLGHAANDAAVLDGANWLWIGGEMIGFRYATLVDGETDKYQLSRLIRGRRDTGERTGTHQMNEVGVLVSALGGAGLAPINYDEADLGIPQNYKVVSSGQLVADAVAIQDAGLSTRCSPFRPCNVRGRREGTIGGSSAHWEIEWTRTDRKLFRSFSQAPPPMSDSQEVYKVEILNPSTDEVVRTITTTATPSGTVITLSQFDAGGNTVRFPHAKYTYTDQLADFGAVQDTIKVNLFQVGDLVVRGNVRTETITAHGHY